MNWKRVAKTRGLSAAFGCLVLWALETAAAAQAPNVHFRRLALEDGLSQAIIQAIHQDRVGFMWFGTQEGLNRYDGYEFDIHTHDPLDQSSLSGDWIRAILEDRQGNLWIGTANAGLSYLDRTTGEFRHHRSDDTRPGSLASDRIRVLLLDRRGELWVGTGDAGLVRFDPETETFVGYGLDVAAPESQAGVAITSILEGRRGQIWVGTDGEGLRRLNPITASVEQFRHRADDPTSLSSDRVRSLFEDREGRLWVGTYDGGLNRLDTPSGGFVAYRHRPEDTSSLSSDLVIAIFEDSRGSLWIGTDNGLNLKARDAETFSLFKHDPADPSSLSDNRVTSLYEDRGGVLWVGTYGGLSRWNVTTGSFAHFKNDPTNSASLSNNIVTAFARDNEDDIWIGTYGGGLNRLDHVTRRVERVGPPTGGGPGLPDKRVMSLHVDRSGVLWIGTFSGGLGRLDTETGELEVYRHDPNDPKSLSRDSVASILEDRLGRLWVGVYRGGLNRLDRASGEFRRFEHDPEDPYSLSSDRIVSLMEDSSGVLWVATDGGGLNRLAPGGKSFVAVRNDAEDGESLSSDHVGALHEDREGTIWIGTQGAGLNRWTAEDRGSGRTRFSRYGKSDGLLSAVIFGILSDDEGFLWISTNRGLSRLDPSSGALKHYDPSNGLQGLEFNSGAAFRSPDGEMFFGGPNGFNAFNPSEIRDNTHVPPVVLTAISVGDRVIRGDGRFWEIDRIELDHKVPFVSFEFAALDFTAPEQNRFQYRLEGFDQGWIDLGNNRRGIYTRVDPGEFVFQVRASNNDGVWNEAGIALPVVSLPPPWRTLWAYSIYLVLGGGALVLYLRAQRKKQERSVELTLTNEMLKREIAEREAKEEALRQEKEKAQRYLDVAQVIMVVLDGDGRISLINQKGCEVLGYQEEEILGRDWFDTFVPMKARADVRGRLQLARPTSYLEYSVLTKRGDERSIAWQTTTLPGEDGNPVGFLASGTDVTQIRELEKQLRTSQKMDAIGTLVGGIAHDFNNILTAILGYTAMAKQGAAGNRTVEEDLEQVSMAGQRAKELVSQILTFSRRGERKSQTLSVQSILGEALKLLRASLPSSVEIRTEIDKRTPAIRADPVQIHQVIMNLCTNAFQAMPGMKGRLEISLEEYTPDEEDRRLSSALSSGPHALLTVTDDGSGMDATTQERIFDPFFTTKGIGEGTGLGLSVVHGIVTQLGGDIRVSSRLGEGSSFRILLPCSEDSEVSVDTPPPLAEIAGRERILFVDDEKAIVEMGRRMLETIGYRVSAFKSPDDALETFSLSPEAFDLLITDQVMPGMTGLELAARLRELVPDLPVIVASGFGHKPGSEASDAHLIDKPYTVGDLGRAIRQCLARRSDLPAGQPPV